MTVYFKKHSPAFINAVGYTESPEENKIYFHKSQDKSDRIAFFVLSEVIGVDVEPQAATIDISPDAVLRALRAGSGELSSSNQTPSDDCNKSTQTA
jgi:hypothetical protein